MVGAQRLAHHPLAPAAAPGRADHRLLDADVAANILLEAGLSFLGVGIPLPDRELGQPALRRPDYYLAQPWLMVWPGLAVLITTLAFNLLGDGLRDAFDPRASLASSSAEPCSRSHGRSELRPAANQIACPLVSRVGMQSCTWVDRESVGSSK